MPFAAGEKNTRNSTAISFGTIDSIGLATQVVLIINGCHRACAHAVVPCGCPGGQGLEGGGRPAHLVPCMNSTLSSSFACNVTMRKLRTLTPRIMSFFFFSKEDLTTAFFTKEHVTPTNEKKHHITCLETECEELKQHVIYYTLLSSDKVFISSYHYG